MHEQAVQPGLMQYLLPIAGIAVIFAFRVRRMSRARPLSLGQLWIVPAMYAMLVVATFATRPPHGIGWLVVAMTFVLGSAIGWQRGRMMSIHVDPASGTLLQKGSPLAVLFLLAIFGLRALASTEGLAMHADVTLLTDAALAFALGMFTAPRLEMFLRGRRLLREHVAGVFS